VCPLGAFSTRQQSPLTDWLLHASIPFVTPRFKVEVLYKPGPDSEVMLYKNETESFVVKRQRGTKELVREIDRLDKLRHPLIAEVSAVFYSTPGEICVKMPYYKNGTIRDWMCKLSDAAGDVPGDVQRRMQELVLAVSFLHQHGIVHRDLKPENVGFRNCRRRASPLFPVTLRSPMNIARRGHESRCILTAGPLVCAGFDR
jgi:hypothetical protein